MSEQTQTNPSDRVAIQAIAGGLGSSMKSIAATADAQQVAILGVAAILACLPDTAKIPQDRLTAALALLTHGRSKAFTEKLAKFIATGVATSRQIPEVAEQIKKAKAKTTKN